MGKHSGEPVEETPPPPAPMHQRLPALGASMVVTVIAWGFLVDRGIHFGSQGKRGETTAWLFCSLATLGAVACLFAALILGARIVAVLKGDPLRRRASVGGKRAAR